MSTATGETQRLWANDGRPGLLWYLPSPDRLVEWRFDTLQPGPLTFEAVERCFSGTSPCVLGDAGGRWHPVMGQFTGSPKALDVYMYGADEGQDLLLRNQTINGTNSFDPTPSSAPRRAVPVVGNFGPGTRDQILWYRPGPTSDELWSFQNDGSHQVVPVSQDGYVVPLTGHFRSRSFATDILWFDPREATIDTWVFGPDFGVTASGPGSVESLGVTEGTEYLPIIGNFNGDHQTDVFWYAPGSAPDWLWLSDSNQDFILFDSYSFSVEGEYHPLTGDFDADGDDDILWYRPAGETEGGPSWMWYFDGEEFEAHSLLIQGDYVPYVEDFDSDGCTDILWYDPVSPAAGSPLWRCLPQQKTFSCNERLQTPELSYPIGFATGGY